MSAITPEAFVTKWGKVHLKETVASQSHSDEGILERLLALNLKRASEGED